LNKEKVLILGAETSEKYLGTYRDFGAGTDRTIQVKVCTV